MLASILDYVLVGVLGGLVGVTELVTRYKDAPARAIKTHSAALYISVNALASVGALMAMRIFGWDFGHLGSARRFLQILIAGLSAMVLFRSALFVVRVGARDVDVGPSTVLQVILGASDRDVDRKRAAQRSSEIATIMANVSFAKAYDALPAFCLALMQNVPAEEQADLAVQIKALQGGGMDDALRSLNLGLALMNVIGADVLRTAVTTLGSRIT